MDIARHPQVAIPLLQSKLQNLYGSQKTTRATPSAHAAAGVISASPGKLGGDASAGVPDVAFVHTHFLQQLGLPEDAAVNALIKGATSNTGSCSVRLVPLTETSGLANADLLLPPLLAYNLGLLFHLHPFLNPGQADPLVEQVHVQICNTPSSHTSSSSSSSTAKVAQQVVICKVAQPSRQPINFHDTSTPASDSSQEPSENSNKSSPSDATTDTAAAEGAGKDGGGSMGLLGGPSMDAIMEELHNHFMSSPR